MLSRASIFKDACDALLRAGHDTTFRPEYSGRGMYGKTCPAIVTDAPAAVVGAAVIEAGGSMYDVPSRSDSMGRGSMVFY